MNANLMSGFFSNATVMALFWTLLHSLWQGLILVLLTGGVITAARKWRPALRYNVLTALFFLFVATSAGTFLYELQQRKDALRVLRYAAGPGGVGVPSLLDVEAVNAPGVWHGLVGFLTTHSALILAAWFCIFSIKCLRIVVGLLHVQRLRHYRTHQPDGVWAAKLAELAGRLGVGRAVRLLESELVSQPVVLGFFKPVILIPLGLVAQLPPDQVESVLLHELAHIRRNDYLVNIAQGVAEIVFFFNPAVLWLSTLIRDEREYCCDDVAVASTSSRLGYVRALAAFQELQVNPPATPLAMGFAGTRHPVLQRIQRIIGNNTQKLNAMEKLLLTVSLLVITGMAVLLGDGVMAQNANDPVTITDIRTERNQDNALTRVLWAKDKQGNEYRISSVNNVMREVYLNGKLVPAGNYAAHNHVFASIDRQLAQEQEAETARLQARDARDDEEERRGREFGERDRAAEAARIKAREARDAEEARKGREMGERDRAAEAARIKAREAWEAEEDRKGAERAAKDEAAHRQYTTNLDGIISDLVKDQVVSAKGGVTSFELTTNRFTVNGENMSTEMYTRYKNKYIKSARESYSYNK